MFPAASLAEGQLPASGEIALRDRRGLATLAALIPAWQPDWRLVDVVRELVDAGFGCLVLVDDGSREECAPVFAAAEAFPQVTVVRHAVNLGKGRALKTGFNHVLSLPGEIVGLVTADADGQHLPDDIVRVGEALLANPGSPMLGVRAFAGEVPLRSRFGNALTRHVFRFLTGTHITDTQTGLRGLPRAVLPELMRLDGERYEYEMTMLAHLCRSGRRLLEVPIATVYLDNNRGSHFDPVWDSMRIYFVLLRFYASSLLSAGLDLALFTVCFVWTGRVLLSVVVGRSSAMVNFWINRRFVFQSRGSVPSSLWRYALLAASIGAASYYAILGLHTLARWPVPLAKVCVDVLLSLLSFAAQRTFVFRRREAI